MVVSETLAELKVLPGASVGRAVGLEYYPWDEMVLEAVRVVRPVWGMIRVSSAAAFLEMAYVIVYNIERK